MRPSSISRFQSWSSYKLVTVILCAAVNKITKIKSLRKMQIPKIKKITFVIMRRLSLRTTSMRLSHWPSLTVPIYRSYCCSGKNRVILSPRTKQLPECYHFLFKMQPDLKLICTFTLDPEHYNTQIIRNSSSKQMLEKRFPESRIILRYDALNWSQSFVPSSVLSDLSHLLLINFMWAWGV